MVSEKNFFKFSFYKKSLEANASRGMANLNPRGMVGRIYVGDR